MQEGLQNDKRGNITMREENYERSE